MKRTLSSLIIGMLAVGMVFMQGYQINAFAQDINALMKARSGWMRTINMNLKANRLDKVVEDANALAAQTATVGAGLTNPVAKEITLRISSLAKVIAEAAGNGNADAISTNLSSIKAACGECHAKFR